MRPLTLSLMSLIFLILVACGGGESATTAAPAPAEVIEVTSVIQFDAELAKARPGAVVVADFHALWCGPCRKLGPDLVALAIAHPGKLYVLKVDTDHLPQLAERYQAQEIPLLVKFTGSKESARRVGYEGKDILSKWLAIP